MAEATVVRSEGSDPGQASDDLVTREDDGAVAILRVNRPKALNALDAATLRRIGERIAEVGADDAVRALVLTGSGTKAFVAGADIAALRDMNPEQASAFSRLGGGVFRQLERLGKPTLAAINGFALGGGLELALGCDVLLAADHAKFGLPEVTLGVIPGFGGTQRMARLIGANAARLWVMSGEIFSAQEALRLGLVYSLHEPEALLPAAIAWAHKMASRGPLAVAAAKSVIDRGLDLGLDAAIELESQAFGQCFATADQREGMDAFLAKRRPEFRGQ